MHFAGTRHPRVEQSPLRSSPLFRPAAVVLGNAADQIADFARSRAIELARQP